MDASSLLAVIGQLQADGISVWIDGGWGVDALLGHQTREHDDLDLVIELEDATRVMGLLGSRGYEMVAGAPPKSFVMVDSRGSQVDLHPVTFDSDGGGVYEMDDGTEWVYPAEGLSGRGSVDGTPVKCLSAAVQVLVHAGYELTGKDYRELYLLWECFGVELPDELLPQVMSARDHDPA